MGAVDLVIVCQPAADAVALPPCGFVGGVAYAPAVVERPLLSDQALAWLDAWNGPVDYLAAGQFAFFSLSVVVALWFAAWAIGRVVGSVNHI